MTQKCKQRLAYNSYMFVYGRSALGLRFGLLILSFFPMGSFVLRVKDYPFFSGVHTDQMENDLKARFKRRATDYSRAKLARLWHGFGSTWFQTPNLSRTIKVGL